MARQTALPAIIHVRDAFAEAHELLAGTLAGEHDFVLHCFSGGPAEAEKFLALGGMISFTGLITFKKAETVRAALRVVPLDRLMFETDSPYLAPEPFRGKRNQPAYLGKIIERAAAELNVDVEELSAATTRNARRFFRLTQDAG